jgi:hypothetical protein
MPSEANLEFVARTRRRIWIVFTLTIGAAILIFVGIHSLEPDFSVGGRGSFLNDIPPWLRAAFFIGCAVPCVGIVIMQMWLNIYPKIEVEAGPQGITSHAIWGKGQLRWADIMALERKGNWLFVRGTGPNAKSKKLVIDTAGIDAPIDNLYALIARHRPDLLARA